MTLEEYLASLLDDNQREKFLEDIDAVGNSRCDLYSDTPPSGLHENTTHIDSALAVVEVSNGDGTTHFHTLVSRQQYAFWGDQSPKPDWFKEASKAAKKFFKEQMKSNGEVEDSPRHVYGFSAFDAAERALMFPDDKPKKSLDDGDE